jgi:hypothetical protein
MADLLAETLIRERLTAARDVEEALKRQVVEGGGLDTLLLEAGVIAEAALLRALGEAYSLPTAGAVEIESVPPHIPRLFPLLFAETYHLVPFRLVGQNLGVLVNRSAEPQIYDRIYERLSLRVQPTVTTEVRLHHAMCRLYGTALLPRYRAILAKLDGDQAVDELTKHTATTSHVVSWGLSTVTLTPARRREDVKKGGLLARLTAADDRDAIVDILLEIVASTFEFAAMFVVHGEQVNGWRGVNAETTARIARVSLPVTLPSVFQTIYATNGHYLGPIPTNSVNTQLIEDLGRAAPRTAFLAPILVGGKLAAIIFADNGTKPVSSKRVASLLLVSHRAGMCLETLIRRKRAVADKLIAETTGAPESPTNAQDLVAETPPPTEAEITVLEDEEFELLPTLTEAVPAEPTPFAAPTHDALEVTEDGPLPPAAEPNAVPEEQDAWESVNLNVVDTAAAAQAARVILGAPPPAPVSLSTSSIEEETSSPPAAVPPIEAEAEEIAPVEVAAEDVAVVVEAPTPETPVSIEAWGEAVAQAEAEEVDDGYVAFSDIDETPEQSIDDWQDVLVETAGLERNVDNRPRPPTDGPDSVPPSVTWENVIAEAEAAPDLLAISTMRKVEVAGTQIDERGLLLDTLDATDPEVWRNAIERLVPLGTALDADIQGRFPGKINFDPFTADVHLPPFSRCSGITALIAARGTGAAELVLPFLESANSLHRFVAVYYLYAVSYAPAVELLARRLYDAEPRTRFLAADALRTYQAEPAYRRIIQGLRDHLKVPVFEAQVATVQVLGQLREPSAVPSLIPLVVSPRQALARASSSALTVICGQSFGADVSRWAEWWQSHFNKPRQTWLTDGTKHDDPNVRKIAVRELQLLTGRNAVSDSGAVPEPRGA